MPNTKSAKKRLKQNEKRRIRNRAGKSALRTEIKKLRTAISDKDLETCQTLFPQVVKKLDQSASKGLIHDNAAARTKSRLSQHIKALKQPAETAS